MNVMLLFKQYKYPRCMVMLHNIVTSTFLGIFVLITDMYVEFQVHHTVI